MTTKQNERRAIQIEPSRNIKIVPEPNEKHLIQMTIILIVLAIISSVLGIYNGVTRPVPVWLRGVAVILIIGVVVVSGLATQTHRAISDLREWR